MKKNLWLLLLTLLVLTAALVACDFGGSQSESTQGESAQGGAQETAPAERLEYRSNDDDTCSVIGIGNVTETEIVIPSTLPNGKRVTGIGNEAFRGCTNITSVTIPDSVTHIGDEAFSGCKSLTSISIPDSVTSIGKYAFSNCVSLTNIIIPDSVTSIGFAAFIYCKDLMSIIVSENNPVYYSKDNCLIEIETNTLKAGCQTSIIPYDVTVIGGGAFQGCVGLTSIIIPSGVTDIGGGAFQDCDGLTSITIPKSVIYIGSNAFIDCASLTDVYFTGTEQQWKEIRNKGIYSSSQWPYQWRGIEMHYNATAPVPETNGGEDQTSPATDAPDIAPSQGLSFSSNRDGTCVLSGYDPLANTSGIVVIPDKSPEGDLVTSIDYSIFGSINLVSVTIPDGVTEIYDFTFASCYSLKEVNLSNNLNRIGAMAFTECTDLTSIILPDSLTSIDYGAFFACDNLTDVYFMGTEEEWSCIEIGSDNDSLTNATIHYNYVP